MTSSIQHQSASLPAQTFGESRTARRVPSSLKAEHRQRMRLPEDPDFDANAPLWNCLLDMRFETTHPSET